MLKEMFLGARWQQLASAFQVFPSNQITPGSSAVVSSAAL